MKTISRQTLSTVAALGLAAATVFGSTVSKPIFLKITSPDHPSTWVVGAHRSAKTLRWDPSRRMLMADVTYSTEDYPDQSDSLIETEDYSLAIPNVRVGNNGKDLLATNSSGESIAIGSIKNGLFGDEIVLNDGVNFKVHRVNGKICASLVYNSLMKGLVR